MRNDWVSGHVHIPDLSRMAFKNASAASLLECRYFSLVHPQRMKDEVCAAIAGVTRSYSQAWEILRNGELRKIAVRASGRTYTLEFDQSPIKNFLPYSPELPPHGDFVTTIKVPRSAHGSWLACTAGFFGIIDECMLVALTTNESWPGARIKFDRVDWRGRAFNAIRYSDNKEFVEYLNIPISICAQVISAYAEKRFVEASEAQRRMRPLVTRLFPVRGRYSSPNAGEARTDECPQLGRYGRPRPFTVKALVPANGDRTRQPGNLFTKRRLPRDTAQ